MKEENPAGNVFRGGFFRKEKSSPRRRTSSDLAYARPPSPGRNHRLLPALAKNMPLACFLNASRQGGRRFYWATVPTASSGCTETSKRTRAATLRGLASAFSGSSSKPEQPEPPRMQPLSRPHGTPTGSGGIAAFAIPPGALWYFLAREKVHAPIKTSSKEEGPPAPGGLLS